MTAEDIQPGAELYMAYVDRDEKADRFPDQIRVDDDPWGERDGVPYLYYHCMHAPELQCFVPLGQFVDVQVETEMSGPHMTTLYLAKRR